MIRPPLNRYYEGSLIYPDRFENNWNHSYILQPEGNSKGAVVLLHGLTDTPYSLRHVADLYHQRGFVVIAIRMPAHGTVPSALSKVHWRDWMTATVDLDTLLRVSSNPFFSYMLQRIDADIPGKPSEN